MQIHQYVGQEHKCNKSEWEILMQANEEWPKCQYRQHKIMSRLLKHNLKKLCIITHLKMFQNLNIWEQQYELEMRFMMKLGGE
jgi:hypothetical protein